MFYFYFYSAVFVLPLRLRPDGTLSLSPSAAAGSRRRARRRLARAGLCYPRGRWTSGNSTYPYIYIYLCVYLCICLSSIYKCFIIGRFWGFNFLNVLLDLYLFLIYIFVCLQSVYSCCRSRRAAIGWWGREWVPINYPVSNGYLLTA